MRAFVITGPRTAEVQQVEPPVPGHGDVIVDVERAGVCGTDAEFFSGEMAYTHSGHAPYPMRIGHEWMGVVSAVGDEVDPGWIGRRVTGDTMLGCRRCDRCASGRQYLCADRYEIGIRGGWPGALAEQLPVPAVALHPLPDTVDAVQGAMVEPGGNALRAVRAAQVVAGERVLVLGPGTIGLLTAQIAAARGIEVHLLGRDLPSLDFARSLGFTHVWTADTLPALRWDAVIDAATAEHLPALALDLVEPGRRVVCIGISSDPSLIDTRTAVLKEVTVAGVLSASGGLAETIDLYAAGSVDPRPLVAATLGLDELAPVLSGARPTSWGHAPKIHLDPRR
ncbi:alcohol dehydrogenase [Acrocarpospora corrugata]|uniref:Alcohol dehydrogenase n=1 Tax=Acrocarpospora corrugata TaxID=35763 RepID=A0A5M3VYQ2_9ACTN|nr:alcohol dehydrogenase catalytic domain-containing protein [Acrocarpospora corrugata]GES01219.1 alcohol dehydrogenase [Acrocarpospora corrugata]